MEEILQLLSADLLPSTASTSSSLQQFEEGNTPEARNEMEFCQQPNCNFQTLWPRDMILHAKKHLGKRRFKCPYCPIRFNYKGNINPHIRSKHSNDKPFSCPHCPYRTTRKSSLTSHIYNRHTTPPSHLL